MGVMDSSTSQTRTFQPRIVPRQNLSFQFGDEVPRYWFANDPFKSRFFDAFSLRLPGGERFFVNCVRDFRDQITDPVLKQEVKDFTMQEGQHTMVHRSYNERLAKQGLPVAEVDAQNNAALEIFRSRFSRETTLSMTAASEHFTALLSHLLFEHPEKFVGADPRVMAMYAYHGAEEIEHKAVAITVLRKVAKVGETKRAVTLAFMTPMFFLATLLITNKLLKADGFSAGRRLRMFGPGLRWIFGRRGMLSVMGDHYFAYFKRGFDPWAVGRTAEYERWIAEFERSNDPTLACRAALQIAQKIA